MSVFTFLKTYQHFKWGQTVAAGQWRHDSRKEKTALCNTEEITDGHEATGRQQSSAVFEPPTLSLAWS